MVKGALPAGRMLFVAGTRPEAVKLAPLILALRARGCPTYLVATGQHRELFHDALTGFGLVADADLAVMRAAQTPAEVVGALLPGLAALCDVTQPAAVIVQGDTATAFAGAQAAVYARRPLIHVEAGLRSGHSDPFPEEMHRRAIAQLADVHFAPTPAARAALLREGVAAAAVTVTGNSGIDAVLWMQARLQRDAALRAAAAANFAGVDARRPWILATVHRRENHGAPLRAVIAALAALAGEAEIVVPVHPHPAVSGPLRAALAGRPGVHLMAPLAYPAFVWLMMRATLALTDSGGVQEEAPALGLPVLVLRDVTERQEGVASGNARLVGTGTAAIVAAVRGVLGAGAGRMAERALPYGAGDAAARMVDVLMARFGTARVAAE